MSVKDTTSICPRAPDHIFDVTGDHESPENVLVRFDLSFGAACQLMESLARQNWRAAVEDLVPHDDPRNMTPPNPVVFTLVGKLNSSGSTGPDCMLRQDGRDPNPSGSNLSSVFRQRLDQTRLRIADWQTFREDLLSQIPEGYQVDSLLVQELHPSPSESGTPCIPDNFLGDGRTCQISALCRVQDSNPEEPQELQDHLAKGGNPSVLDED